MSGVSSLTETGAPLVRGYSIVEGPAWNAASETLFYCDGFTGGIWALGNSGIPELVLPKRRCSGLALHENGGFVVSGRNVGWKHGERSARLLELDPAWGMTFFNDLGTSLEGRVYVGSLDYDVKQLDREGRPGHLHVIDLDGSSRIVADGIGTANGVGVSPDGTILYFNDTSRRLVRRYTMLPNGDLREEDPLIEFSSTDGGPDGMAVASDGSVLVALPHSHCVGIISAKGTEQGRIDVPGHHVTSMCFGGRVLGELFITTMCNGDDGETDGSVFRVRAPVTGMPVPPARVKVQPASADGSA